MRLSELKKDQLGVIVGIDDNCEQIAKQRFLDLGFVKGSRVQVENVSPFKDPTSYLIHSAQICLRKKDAQLIFIEIIKG